MQYRREIEGLRALAVIPVVLFHAWMPGLGGGFAGVDVFFVISGYLITRSILDDSAQQRFTLLQFYERRARRILPALVPVLLVSLLLAWVTMIPPDFRKFSQSLAASTGFAANMLFARKTGYFEDDEGFAPLLHLWTLSVEEQFYIVFPVLMLALLKLERHFTAQRGRVLLAAFAGLALASFAAGLIVQDNDPALAFFTLPTRAWELLVGAACAALPAGRTRGWPALAGLAMTGMGYVLGDPSATPGWALLLPVIGAALVLRHAAPQNLAGKLLNLAPLTAIGAASYGIYLWHNPLLATLDYVWLGDPPLWITGGTVALAVLLGFASLHLLERPVRDGRLLRSPMALVLGCGAMLAVVLALGIAGHLRWLKPRSAPVNQALGNHAPPGERVWEIVPHGTRPLRFIVYGDSFARQYFPALAKRYGDGALYTAPGCLGLPGLTNFADQSEAAQDCASRPAQLAQIVRERKIGTVIWAQRWEREMFETGSLRSVGKSSGKGWTAVRLGIERLRRTLPPETRVIIVGNAPTAAAAGDAMEGGYVRCLAFINIVCPSSYPRALAEGHRINPLLAGEVIRLPNARFFDPAQVLCDGTDCALMRQGKAIYHDWTHLTDFGADTVVRRFAAENPAL
ncbi:MAG: acyltransferase family protein [Novosphingobium sp.]|uniref:acyltransferase family protein n=1 Tax=Novosphingobium sp. TaxID=1874826 RepID=UPI002736A2C6|nr:acyltransferase family protein [Novosphingobium sp.]MDP3549789.1 acyltransferase family protein [Novosphingobium sp.]